MIQPDLGADAVVPLAVRGHAGLVEGGDVVARGQFVESGRGGFGAALAVHDELRAQMLAVERGLGAGHADAISLAALRVLVVLGVNDRLAVRETRHDQR